MAIDAASSSVRPGPAALRFARSDLGVADLVELARPSMRRLAAESGETTNLIVPRPGGTEAIAQVDGSHLLGVTNWVGRPLGLHMTAAGKVFLAFGTSTLPDGELDAPTPATITDRERLEAELETVRERGYATIVDELETGLSAVGAPIRERGGAVVAVLCVSGATLRLRPQRLELARARRRRAGRRGCPSGSVTQRTERISRSNVSTCSASTSRARSASPAAIARSRSSCSCTRVNRCGRRSSTRYQIRSDRLK